MPRGIFIRTQESRHKSSLTKLGSLNPNWSGNKVGFNGIHSWVRRRLKPTKLCQECNLVPPYDLANISQKYKRNLSDWEWLCRKCHMTKDGRLKKLKTIADSRRFVFEINCPVCKKVFLPKLKRIKTCSKSCGSKFSWIINKDSFDKRPKRGRDKYGKFY